MARTHRLSTTGALIVCLVGTQWSGTLFASAEEPSSTASSSESVVNSRPDAQGWTSVTPAAVVPSRFALSNEMLTANGSLGTGSAHVWRSTPEFVPVDSASFAQRGGYRGRGRGGRNGGPAAAIVLGAAASIAGTAVLVYANRPECNANLRASGCGYGTKVVGGAVLSAGVVGVIVGALTWR